MDLTSLLQTSFVEFLKSEWLGLVASLFVLVSFLMTNQIKIRIINMVGCIAFVIYGFLLPTYSTAFMNGAVFIVHVVFLIRHFVKKHKEKAAKIEINENSAPQEETEKAEEPENNELQEETPVAQETDVEEENK